MKKFVTISMSLLLIFAGCSFAQTGTPTDEKNAQKYLTRSDAARLLTATDFLKNKIGQLLSWSIGYDISAVNRAKLVPTIRYIRAQPIKVPPDGRTVLALLVAVDDPGGLDDISGVRADLSNIGQSPNTALVDNGLWGDTKAGDGVYTIQTSVKMSVEGGEKDISVAVANKKGWLTLSTASLDVEKNPVIIRAGATPSQVKADGKTRVTLEVAIENPGRIDALKGVAIDLTSIGGGKAYLKKSAKEGVFSLGITVPRGTGEGEKRLHGRVTNVIGGQSPFDISLTVIK